MNPVNLNSQLAVLLNDCCNFDVGILAKEKTV